MKVPQGMTEAQVTELITKVSNRVANRYKFGFYDTDDIFQEAFIIGMDGLERYDGNRPLENFLAVHISNRLKTFRRDNYYRSESLCKACNNEDPYCKVCERRQRRVNSKKGLMEPITLDNVQDQHEHNMKAVFDFLGKLEQEELFNLIESKLDIFLVEDYLRLMDGVELPKARREKIEQEIVKILVENGYGEETWQVK